MSVDLVSLVPLLRVMADDNSIDLQEFTDQQLADEYLRVGVMLQEASWNQGYIIEGSPGSYSITPDPPQWMTILFTLKTALGMRIWQKEYSIDNHILKITRTSKNEDIKSLQELYQEVINERKNSGVGYVSTSFDDYFTRYYDILDAINQGYR